MSEGFHGDAELNSAIVSDRPCISMLVDWFTDSGYGPRDTPRANVPRRWPVGLPNLVRTAGGLSRHTGEYCRKRSPRPLKQGRLETWQPPASTFSSAASATASSTHSPHAARNARLACVVWRIRIFVSFGCRESTHAPEEGVSLGTSQGEDHHFRSCLRSSNMPCS